MLYYIVILSLTHHISVTWKGNFVVRLVNKRIVELGKRYNKRYKKLEEKIGEKKYLVVERGRNKSLNKDKIWEYGGR